jgi:hypothetical protein
MTFCKGGKWGLPTTSNFRQINLQRCRRKPPLTIILIKCRFRQHRKVSGKLLSEIFNVVGTPQIMSKICPTGIYENLIGD